MTDPALPEKPKKKRDVHKGDRAFFWLMRGFAVSILLLLAAIVQQLLDLSLPAWKVFGLGFLTSTEWDPVRELFGAGPFIFGTVVSSLIAILLATPVSLGVALFLNELAPRRVASVFGFLVEMLAAIPSVVYGLWGIFVFAPLLRTSVEPFLGKYLGFIPLFQGPPYGVGMLAAGVILAIMVTPTISAICREIFRAIPMAQREAALALGATRWEMMSVSVLKSSSSGIFGAVILGLGRALGETMAVTMVIGNRPEISASLFAPGQTMASVIANEYAEATSDIHLAALAGIGFSLFLVSFVINSAARGVIWRAVRRSRA